MKRIVSAERFWEVYSVKLNEHGNLEDYKNDTSWTSIIIKKVAKETCKELGFESSTEYYRVDLVGYRREKSDVEGNWWLDLAYEHENKDTWWGELCKLCYVAADLRVISTYYRLGGSGKTIEYKLRGYLERLGKEKIFRVPNSQWLFVFGPRLDCADQPFMSFTIDDELNINPVQGGQQVVPKDWERRDS